MRIDGNNNIDGVYGNYRPARPESSGAGKTADSKAVEVELNAETAELAGKAAAAADVDAQAVADAKAMLEAGQLDSPETILKAAENLLDFGL